MPRVARKRPLPSGRRFRGVAAEQRTRGQTGGSQAEEDRVGHQGDRRAGGDLRCGTGEAAGEGNECGPGDAGAELETSGGHQECFPAHRARLL